MELKVSSPSAEVENALCNFYEQHPRIEGYSFDINLVQVVA